MILKMQAEFFAKFATKDDLKEVKNELNKKIDTTRTELNGRMDSFRNWFIVGAVLTNLMIVMVKFIKI